MVAIRPYRASDLPALYDICLKTGDNGADATRLYADPGLIGEIFAAPYAALEPGHAFVAEDDEGVAARDRRWTSRTVMTATAFLLVFNAVSPLNWARQQPPGWVPEAVRQLSEVWVAQLSVFAVDQPRQGLREAWEAARQARFIGQGEPDASTPAAES